VHRLNSTFVLGYHGCDKAVAEKLISGAKFRTSQNVYDWLGHGIYFWEANPKRGLDFAAELKARGRGRITEPAVVGAVIDLGLCLDLMSTASVQSLLSAHQKLVEIHQAAEQPLPENAPDLLRRNLDCAVIRLLHQVREEAGEEAVDTVRGVFIEGEPIYSSSGFFSKTHIQICVCNPLCIKGVFRVPDHDLA
jgi:hypothetical protein